MYDFEIPCPHPGTSVIERLPNYRPLTRDEIVNLLEFSKAHKGDGSAVSSAQVRLIQSIPGMTCPRPVGGAVGLLLLKVEQLFVERYDEGATESLVDKLMWYTR